MTSYLQINFESFSISSKTQYGGYGSHIECLSILATIYEHNIILFELSILHPSVEHQVDYR